MDRIFDDNSPNALYQTLARPRRFFRSGPTTLPQPAPETAFGEATPPWCPYPTRQYPHRGGMAEAPAVQSEEAIQVMNDRFGRVAPLSNYSMEEEAEDRVLRSPRRWHPENKHDFQPDTSPLPLQTASIRRLQRLRSGFPYRSTFSGLEISAGAMQEFTRDMVGTIDRLRKEWPRDLTSYPPVQFQQIYLAWLAIASRSMEATRKVRADPTAVTEAKEGAFLTGQRLTTIMARIQEKYLKVMNEHLQTGSPIEAPDFRNDILAGLGQAKLTWETAQFIDGIQPWFLDNFIAEYTLAAMGAMTKAIQFVTYKIAQLAKRGTGLLKYALFGAGAFAVFWLLQKKSPTEPETESEIDGISPRTNVSIARAGGLLGWGFLSAAIFRSGHPLVGASVASLGLYSAVTTDVVPAELSDFRSALRLR